MSSHREAPSISKDPVADNTDTYAFVSDGDTVTLIACYLPAQAPAGGPNFYEFGDDVVYKIHVDNDGDGIPNLTYRFDFRTEITNPSTFLYNTGPIGALDSPSWNRRQTYSLKKLTYRRARNSSNVIGSGLVVPPCNVGPRSTPDYKSLADAATYSLPTGERVFAGQRADPFFVDLGSVFDLGALRPIQSLHLLGMPDAPGVDALAAVNVHAIAIQVPIAHLTKDGSVPTDVLSPSAVIGVWATAERRKGRVLRPDGVATTAGPLQQVSRLGNPLFNEVIVPMVLKDKWNAVGPAQDGDFAQYVAHPELAGLLPVLYPGAFPNLAALNASGADRADLLAVLLTGIPEGLIDGFQNFTGPTQADMLRLNVAVPPAAAPNRLGLVGGDPAGFPNGRRVADDVVTIELRAVAGAVYPLVDPSFVPDAAIGAVEDGTFGNPGRFLLENFPFVGLPYSGFEVPAAS